MAIKENPKITRAELQNFYAGTRTIKFLRSGEIRTVRDVCISKINGLEVFL